MPRKQMAMRRVMTPRKKGNSQPFSWIVEHAYAWRVNGAARGSGEHLPGPPGGAHV